MRRPRLFHKYSSTLLLIVVTFDWARQTESATRQRDDDIAG